MKSIKRSRLGGTISLSTLAAVLLLASQSSTSFAKTDSCCADVKQSAAQTLNRGYLTTPRAREEFPWLTRGGPIGETRAKTAPEVIAALKANRALANSPRFIEEHPELLRGAGQFTVTTPAAVPAEVLRNSALVASPRTREEFPALLRLPSAASESDSKVQVAPLK